MIKKSLSRRDFMRLGAGAAALGAAAKVTILEAPTLWASPGPVAPSDTVRFGIIGTGVRGCELLNASLKVPGVECVAAADLYDSRHEAAKEALGGKDIFTTREYRQILDRKDIDAVFVATMDHWHRKVVVEAAETGKDVYCEKPMSHSVEDGFAMIDAIQKNKRMCTIGSQRVSSIVYAKAHEIFAAGKLGMMDTVFAAWDRNSDSGAWVYPIPPDASEQTIDWNTFLDGQTKRPYDPIRFFRWRCYEDYGAGLAGDLFVHLLSGIQRVTGVNAAPSRAMSTGGLFYFKDGRDYPDLLLTMYDYPDYRVVLRCNHNNDYVDEYFGFYGKQGTLLIEGSKVTYIPQDTRPQPEAYSIYGWPKKLRDQYLEEWHANHPEPKPGHWTEDAQAEVFVPPPGYSDLADHENNFFNSVRTRKPVMENEVFGNNTALGCHMSNYSYFHRTVANFDAEAKEIKG
jgi:predicted dehydrogenase